MSRLFVTGCTTETRIRTDQGRRTEEDKGRPGNCRSALNGTSNRIASAIAHASLCASLIMSMSLCVSAASCVGEAALRLYPFRAGPARDRS